MVLQKHKSKIGFFDLFYRDRIVIKFLINCLRKNAISDTCTIALFAKKRINLLS
jgi:hypothetical protein